MKELIVHNDPKSPIAEAYRNIRTNMQFANLDRNLKTIMITSSTQGEGKTTTISNVAISLSTLGKKVIIIDSDLRRPRIHKAFNLTNNKGLTDALLENSSYKEYIQKGPGENLYILTAGQIPPNPSEMLSSNSMKKLIEEIKEEYDYVLIDAPPVVIVTDAAIISTFADGVILVCASGEAEIEIIKRAKENLQKVNANILGVVINKLPLDNSKSYSYYSYYYGEEENKNNKFKKRNKFQKVVMQND